MTAIPSIMQAALAAHRVFGRAANTQLAVILIFVIISLIASTLAVIRPGFAYIDSGQAITLVAHPSGAFGLLNLFNPPVKT